MYLCCSLFCPNHETGCIQNIQEEGVTACRVYTSYSYVYTPTVELYSSAKCMLYINSFLLLPVEMAERSTLNRVCVVVSCKQTRKPSYRFKNIQECRQRGKEDPRRAQMLLSPGPASPRPPSPSSFLSAPDHAIKPIASRIGTRNYHHHYRCELQYYYCVLGVHFASCTTRTRHTYLVLLYVKHVGAE